MLTLLLAALAFALAASVLALCREVRLRKALARLLQQLLSRWRAYDSKEPENTNCLDRDSDVRRRL